MRSDMTAVLLNRLLEEFHRLVDLAFLQKGLALIVKLISFGRGRGHDRTFAQDHGETNQRQLI